jgi:transposase
LRQVEGIGPLTALTFVLTLEDPHRFERSRMVGAYLGLVPASDRSGDRDPQRRISKEGDEMLSVSFWWAAPTTSSVPSDPTRISGATEKR